MSEHITTFFRSKVTKCKFVCFETKCKVTVRTANFIDLDRLLKVFHLLNPNCFHKTYIHFSIENYKDNELHIPIAIGQVKSDKLAFRNSFYLWEEKN